MLAGGLTARAAIVVLAMVVGCKGSKRAAVEDAASDDSDDAEPGVELFEAVAAGDLQVVLERGSGFETRHAVMYIDRPVNWYDLVVTSQTAEPVQVTLPRYLFAHLADYRYPEGADGCLPEQLFLFAPPVEEIEVAPGEPQKLRVDELWFIGDADLMVPTQPHGPVDTYAVDPVPDDHAFIALADVVHEAPELGGLAFAIAGGCTPERWIMEAGLARGSIHVAQVERALRSAGLDPSTSRVFEETRLRRESALARLTTELDTFRQTRSIEGLAIMHAPHDREFVRLHAGDVQVAELVARYLEPDPDFHWHPSIVLLLERLGVATAPVLDALDRVATYDTSADTRALAATAREKLTAAPP